MKQITFNPNNEPYYSEDFIKGFKCGAQRQLEADSADRPQTMSNDTIYREDAINVVGEIETMRLKGQIDLTYAPTIKRLKAIPSADRTQGEWIDTAISIIDDMQREGIIDYEQAWEFRMRARMKGE